jgi:mRNA-degrading endonuclease RelE of RelBE toxin-antitoxin system
MRKLDALQEEPRPVGVEKLAGAENLYRVRVGDWRIVYAIRDRELVVIVIARIKRDPKFAQALYAEAAIAG